MKWLFLALIGALLWAGNADAQSAYDGNRNLKVNCVTGCSASSGTGFNNADAVAPVATGLSGTQTFLYGFDGTDWDRLQVDGSFNLKVNCASGCAGGTFNNDSDAVATSAVNGQTAAWLYGFNGTTFDRLRVDGSKNLNVDLQTALPAGSATIGAVNQAGSWTVGGTGTFTVAGSVTANAGTGTFTVGQATGSNLHVVCDSGCSSSSAPADESTFTAGTTSQTPVGGFFQTTATSNPLTTGQMGAFQVTANRALFTNLRNASGTEIGTSTTPVQVSVANTGANGTAIKVDGSAVTQPVSGTVTANAGTGTFAISAASLPLPTGAATAAGLTTINTTLGSPFQAGGSIGNTAFGATQSGTWTVQPGNTPNTTPWLETISQGGNSAAVTAGSALKVDGSAVTQPISASSLPLPTGAATASNQTNASQKTQIVDGSGNVIASTSNSLNVQCANCSGSGASGTDEGTFTAGTSVFAPGGGFFQTTATNNALTNGQWGTWQLTANRAGFVNLRNSSGTEIGTSAAPVQVSLANTSSNATAVKVDGSGVTQPVSISGDQAVNVAQIGGSGYALGSTTSSASAPAVIASDQSIVPGLASSGCAGQTVANTLTKPFSNGGSASNLQLVAGVSAKKIHVCAINIGPVAAAVNVALVEGTTTTNACDTGTAGMMGGSTAATGWQFAANGGLTMGNGEGSVAQEATSADNMCLLFSGAVQVSGVVTYAQF